MLRPVVFKVKGNDYNLTLEDKIGSSNIYSAMIGAAEYATEGALAVNKYIVEVLFTVQLFLEAVQEENALEGVSLFDIYDALASEENLDIYNALPVQKNLSSAIDWAEAVIAGKLSFAGALSQLMESVSAFVEGTSLNLESLKDLDIEKVGKIVSLASEFGANRN